MITGIKLHNFKSIYDLPDLKFGEVNFVIGKNGVGKTNLLSAIELTRKLAAGEDLEVAVSEIAPFSIELFTQDSSSSSTSIALYLKDRAGKRYEFTYTITLASNGLVISDEKLALWENNEFNEVYVRKNDNFAARTENSHKLSEIPLGIKRGELALANYENKFASKVASMISSFKVLWFERSPHPYRVRLHKRDSLDLSNLDGLVVSLHQNKKEQFNKAVHIIKQIIPEFEEPKVTSIPPPSGSGQQSEDESKARERFLVYWGDKDIGDLSYTLSGLSDGNLRIIQLIFALFDAEGSSCVIGEEIENGQHYGRIKTLMEVLKHLSVKLNVQLLFTTHSGEILTNISASDVIFCSKDERGHSCYRRLVEVVDIPMVKEELGREPTAKELIDFGVI
ncbi:MAG TPA: AAA family ATPase [Candidatus Saccharimonadales bacterium]|nr:AAA family ATPase [Candidatus Saccharimonadales bacterium]